MSGQYIPKKTLKSSRNRNGRYVGLIFPATIFFTFFKIGHDMTLEPKPDEMLLLKPLQTTHTKSGIFYCLLALGNK